MEVILLEKVEKLGQMGQSVSVAPGYARNYLLPKKKALRATKKNKEYFEAKRSEFEAENLKRKEEASYIADKLEGLKVILIRQASETGQLYGSVRSKDIKDKLLEAGFKVSSSQVILQDPIKMIGAHKIKISLHPEVNVLIEALIAQSEGEAVSYADDANENSSENSGGESKSGVDY